MSNEIYLVLVLNSVLAAEWQMLARCSSQPEAEASAAAFFRENPDYPRTVIIARVVGEVGRE